MSDLFPDDPTRALFSEFRADQLPQVVPPGAADAHRTVRRRRVTTTAVAASLAALTLAGAGIAYTQLTTRTHPLTPASPTPTVDHNELDDLANQARAAVGASEPANTPGVLAGAYGPLTTTIQNVDQGENGRGLPTGSYTLTYACRGTGMATITWSIGGQTRTATMTCSKPTPPTPLKPDGAVSDTGGGVMTVRIEPDNMALNHAGYAYVIKRA